MHCLIATRVLTRKKNCCFFISAIASYRPTAIVIFTFQKNFQILLGPNISLPRMVRSPKCEIFWVFQLALAQSYKLVSFEKDSK